MIHPVLIPMFIDPPCINSNIYWSTMYQFQCLMVDSVLALIFFWSTLYWYLSILVYPVLILKFFGPPCIDSHVYWPALYQFLCLLVHLVSIFIFIDLPCIYYDVYLCRGLNNYVFWSTLYLFSCLFVDPVPGYTPAWRLVYNHFSGLSHKPLYNNNI